MIRLTVTRLLAVDGSMAIFEGIEVDRDLTHSFACEMRLAYQIMDALADEDFDEDIETEVAEYQLLGPPRPLGVIEAGAITITQGPISLPPPGTEVTGGVGAAFTPIEWIEGS